MKIVYTDARRSKSQTPWESNDCTVRAYALIHGLSYDAAHAIAEFKGRIPHTQQKGWYYYILEERGADGTFSPGIRVLELANMFLGRFVCRYPGHVFALIDGVRYDIHEDVSPLVGDGGNPVIHEVWKID